ncbi:MAG: hypothetical protein ACI822_001448 [Gammaproteobacteria bacterium]|jgi:hypothetical protein
MRTLNYSLLLLGIFTLTGRPALAAEPYFMHCYDFGCKSAVEIRYDEAQWSRIKKLFNQSLSMGEEKQAIRQAIAMMESYSGAISGTYRDKGGNYPGYDIIKQLDCIDESTNTYQYLSALDELELLSWHQVAPKHRRIAWFITHWTAAIVEKESGHQFAVDSWYRDNGEMPYLQPMDDWISKRDFPIAFNPELAG